MVLRDQKFFHLNKSVEKERILKTIENPMNTLAKILNDFNSEYECLLTAVQKVEKERAFRLNVQNSMS